VRIPLLAAALLAASCTGAGDRERLGDEAYGQAHYAEALDQYTSVLGSNPDPRVYAKAGAAALHGGELRKASDAYIRLAAEDPTRAQEAAEGLETVARAADRKADTGSLQHALSGLQAIAPERLTGRYAVLLAARPGVDGAELVALLPGAIAAAPEGGTVDSLLTLYGSALRVTSGCGQALLQFRAVLRRSADSSMRAKARSGVAGCAFTLGERADSQGKLLDAALWFAEAARADSVSPVGRRASLRAAEARLAQGDTIAAALTFQSVVSAGTADSAGQVAIARLRALGISQSRSDSIPPAGRP
jgi:tetratricopeptide (TPR) repeat protein